MRALFASSCRPGNQKTLTSSFSRSCGTTAAVSNYSKRELILLAAAVVVICMLAWIVMFAE